MPLLYAIVNAKSARQAFLFGWLSQTIAWLMMVPWVVRVMSHYGGLPYLTGVAIFFAMSLYLGLYGAAFALVVYALKPRERFLPWLLVPLAWAAIELARTYLLTGFPWNLLGAAIVDYTPLIQIDRFAGPYFLGFLVLLPAVTITWLLTQRPHPMLRLMVASAVAIVMFVWWATGYVREKIATMDTRDQVYTAALLQPNISQEMRWNDANVIAIFQRMMSLTDVASRNGADVIIWPESTVPLSYAVTDFYRNAIESFSAQHKADIILGSVAEDPSQPDKLWNAAFLVSGARRSATTIRSGSFPSASTSRCARCSSSRRSSCTRWGSSSSARTTSRSPGSTRTARRSATRWSTRRSRARRCGTAPTSW